jgi:ORF6N domain
MTDLIRPEGIEHFIFLIRDQRVMIDRDLATIYGVETKYLNRQVKRNPSRFPPEFMFQLGERERDELVTNWHRFSTMKHSSQMPYAFTEHGIAMLSTVLNSEQAITMSIQIIKTFIRFREILALNQEFDCRFNALEEKVDYQFSLVFEAIDAMRILKNEPIRPVGFRISAQKDERI